MKGLWLLPVAVVAVFLLTTFAKYPLSFLMRYTKGFTTTPLAAGMPAPQFDLETISGERVALAQLGERPLLIKFWSIY